MVLLNYFISTLSLKLNSYILDGGCGTGYFTHQLSSKFKNVIGLEYSDSGIKYCQRFKNNKYVQGDLNTLPFDNNSFDAIVCSDVFYHKWISIDKTFLEIKRVLKYNGYLLVHDAALSFWAKELDDGQQMLNQRFNKKDIVLIANKYKFGLIKFSYTSFFLFFPALIVYFVKHLIKNKTPETEKIKFNAINPIINKIIIFLYKIELLILKRWYFPVGVNCFYILKNL